MFIFFLPTTRNLFCRIIFEQESTSLELFYNVQLNILNIYLLVEFSSVFLRIETLILRKCFPVIQFPPILVLNSQGSRLTFSYKFSEYVVALPMRTFSKKLSRLRNLVHWILKTDWQMRTVEKLSSLWDFTPFWAVLLIFKFWTNATEQ